MLNPILLSPVDNNSINTVLNLEHLTIDPVGSCQSLVFRYFYSQTMIFLNLTKKISCLNLNKDINTMLETATFFDFC